MPHLTAFSPQEFEIQRPAAAAADDRTETDLLKSTQLPPAGEINTKYLGFVDAVAESWDAEGKSAVNAARVGNIMFRALDRTFQSPRILRHLVHVLAAQNALLLFERAIDIYVHIVKKARSTNAAEVARVVREARGTQGTHASSSDPGVDDEQDEAVVKTLVFASQVLALASKNPAKALDLAVYATEIVHSDDYTNGAEISPALQGLIPEVERALGIAFHAKAGHASSFADRKQILATATEHFVRAATLAPGDWQTGYYFGTHLAVLGEPYEAEEQAKRAVELAPHEPQTWHLLVLLLSAADLEKAHEVANAAVDALAASTQASHAPLLSQRLQQHVSLRITRNRIIESLFGADAALHDQKLLFAFHAAVAERIRAGIAAYAETLPADEASAFLAAGAARDAAARRTEPAIPASVISMPETVKSRTGSVRSLGHAFGSLLRGDIKETKDATTPDKRKKERSSVPRAGAGAGAAAADPLPSPAALESQGLDLALSHLWLLAAATYRRADQLSQATLAVSHASQLAPENPLVWVQEAHIARARDKADDAAAALARGLAHDPHSMEALLMRTELLLDSTDPLAVYSAETLLTGCILGAGWNDPRVWSSLSVVYERTGRFDRQTECLEYTYQLLDVLPIRSFAELIE